MLPGMGMSQIKRAPRRGCGSDWERLGDLGSSLVFKVHAAGLCDLCGGLGKRGCLLIGVFTAGFPIAQLGKSWGSLSQIGPAEGGCRHT